MANQDTTNPEFISLLRKLETTDPGHADTFNPLFKILINNDVYLKNYINTKIDELVNGAPEALNTLLELANALGNDSNFATTVINQITTKFNELAGSGRTTETVKLNAENIQALQEALNTFQQSVTATMGEMATHIINLENRPINDFQARNEIIDIKLKLREQTAINFINKTGIGFYDTFMDNLCIDVANTTAVYNSTNKNVEFTGTKSLKMLPQTFENFNSMNLNLYTNKRYMANVKADVNNSKNIELSSTDKLLYKGYKLWINNKENLIENITSQLTNIDRQNTTIASGPLSTSNEGRKLVRLDNGWLVSAYINGTLQIFYSVSKDNGLTWTTLGYINVMYDPSIYVSICSKGTRVFSLVVTDGATANTFISFDALTANGGSLSGWTLDSNQTSFGAGCSIAINEAKTELHACWSSKNNTYPNSFNIRYSKGTINSDGTVTWGTVEQITTYNGGNDRSLRPSIACVKNKPFIAYQVTGGSSIVIRYYSPLGSGAMYVGGNYNQDSPSVLYVPQSINGLVNGRIWVTWYGSDSIDANVANIRICYSDDLGLTWSTTQKLTSGNNYTQAYPSITANKNNEIFVVWGGLNGAVDAVRYMVRSIKNVNGSWGSIQDITTPANNGNTYPSTLVDFNINFSSPLLIYTRNQSENKVGFYGKWEDFGGYTATLKDTVTLQANDKLSIIDMEVKQDGQALSLIAVDNEKLMYKATNLNTNTAKIEVLGSENKLESLIYAIA